eukprot:7472201-Pyramimonas_sp.AAC.1
MGARASACSWTLPSRAEGTVKGGVVLACGAVIGDSMWDRVPVGPLAPIARGAAIWGPSGY